MKLKTGQVRALNKTLMVAFLVSFLVAPEAALPQTPFYQGKTLTIIQGRPNGLLQRQDRHHHSRPRSGRHRRHEGQGYDAFPAEIYSGESDCR